MFIPLASSGVIPRRSPQHARAHMMILARLAVGLLLALATPAVGQRSPPPPSPSPPPPLPPPLPPSPSLPPPMPTRPSCSCSEDAVQAAKEAVQAAKDAEQAKQAAATLMEEYERRKLSAAALESASSGLSLGQTIGVAVGCSLAVVLLVAALGLFVFKRGRRKGPSATNEAASGVQLKAETQASSEPSESRAFNPAIPPEQLACTA